MEANSKPAQIVADTKAQGTLRHSSFRQLLGQIVGLLELYFLRDQNTIGNDHGFKLVLLSALCRHLYYRPTDKWWLFLVGFEILMFCAKTESNVKIVYMDCTLICMDILCLM